MTQDPRSAALEALTNTPDYHLRSLELSAAAMYSGASIEAVRKALAARTDLPRRLSLEEEEALRFAVGNSDSADRSALLMQVASARVRGYCGCGCATVELAILDPDAPRANEELASFEAVEILDDQGETIGGVVAFVVDGLLHTLELVDYGDGPIAPMPPLDRLVLKAAR